MGQHILVECSCGPAVTCPAHGLTANPRTSMLFKTVRRGCNRTAVSCSKNESVYQMWGCGLPEYSHHFSFNSVTPNNFCFRTLWIYLGSGSQDAEWRRICDSKNQNCQSQLPRVRFCGAEAHPAEQVVLRLSRDDKSVPK